MKKTFSIAPAAVCVLFAAALSGCAGGEESTVNVYAPASAQVSQTAPAESAAASSVISPVESSVVSSSSSSVISSSSSVISSSSSVVSSSSYVISSSSSAVSSSSSAAAPALPAPPLPDDSAELSGTVLVLGSGYGFACFYGSSYQAESYASYVNKFKSLVGDINVYTLTAPTSGSFYCPEKYLNAYGVRSEKEFTEHIKSCLKSVTSVDAFSELEAHKDEHIYFATDHHWTQLGAYYAGKKFAEAAGVPFAGLEEFDEVSRDGYVGSLYMYSNYHPTLGNNPETFTYYRPRAAYSTVDHGYGDFYLSGGYASDIINEYNGWYMVFGADNIIRHVKTEAGTGRKLMMIKDSYGNAMTPSLISSFDEIFVTDLRYFTGSAAEFAKSQGVTDVLFIMDSFSAAGSSGYFPSIIW